MTDSVMRNLFCPGFMAKPTRLHVGTKIISCPAWIITPLLPEELTIKPGINIHLL